MYTWLKKSFCAKIEEPTEQAVQSFLFLRAAIGIIGLLLPIILFVGGLFVGLQPTISHYYHTPLHGVFVGSLCSIGVFLLSYRGPNKAGDWAGNAACFFAIVTALCPTTPIAGTALTVTMMQKLMGGIHLFAATSLFLILAIFCLVLFPIPDRGQQITGKERAIYRGCGWTILGSIAAIACASLFINPAFVYNFALVFCLETLAILAFGISWAKKGKALEELLRQIPALPKQMFGAYDSGSAIS